MHELKDHPDISKVNHDGYLVKPITQHLDTLGYPIQKGDPVLKLKGKIFAEENLTLNEQIILSECGAVETEA